jgi:hypothetical protein
MLSFVWFCNLCWNTTGKWISTLPFANQFLCDWSCELSICVLSHMFFHL